GRHGWLPCYYLPTKRHAGFTTEPCQLHPDRPAPTRRCRTSTTSSRRRSIWLICHLAPRGFALANLPISLPAPTLPGKISLYSWLPWQTIFSRRRAWAWLPVWER